MASLEQIATAFVGIRPKADPNFERDLNNQINPGLRRVAGDAARVFAGVKLAGFFRGGVDELSEAEKVLSQTRQTIKSTGGAANVTADQVSELASALSEVTGVDDELIQQGSNLLLTFKNVRNEVGKNNAIFDRATEAALDLSKAGFGSMESASIQLGKALNDPVKGMTALQRSGITFTAQQRDQVKTLVESGRVLEAQKIILAEVESQVGGVARAYGETLPGKLERGRNAMDEAKASLTVGLVPALEFGAEAAGFLADAVDGLPPGLQEVASIGLAAGGGVLAFSRPLGDAVTFMRSFNREGAGMLGTLKTIGRSLGTGAAIAGIATAVGALSRALDDDVSVDLTKLGEGLVDLGQSGFLSAEGAERAGLSIDAIKDAVNRLRDTSAVDELNHMGQAIASWGGILGSDDLDDARTILGDLDAALAQVARVDSATAAAALDQITDALIAQGVPAERLAGLFPEYEQTLTEAATASKLAGEGTEDYAEALADIPTLAEKAADEIDGVTDALDDYKRQVFGIGDANLELEDSFDALTEAVHDHGKSLKIENEDGRENLRTVRDLAEAIIDQGQAYIEQGLGADEAKRRVTELTARFDEHLRALGFTETEIANLREQYGLIPENITTVIDANVDPALEEIRRLKEEFERIAPEGSFLDDLIGHLFEPKPRQFGGPFRRGDLIRGAEVGPELFLLENPTTFRAPANGRAIPAGQTRALLGGGGGGTSRSFHFHGGVTIAMPEPTSNPISELMRECRMLEMAG